MTKKRLILLAVIFFASLSTYTISARALSYHVVLNDFWTVFYYARNLTQSIPQSLQNSLFPIGYAAVLHLMPVRHALWMAFFLNVGLASLAVTAAFGLALAGNNAWRAALVGLVAIFYPLTFRYANTTGPDIGVAAFIALGVYFLWQPQLDSRPAPPARSALFLLLSGFFLGLASLWRSHAIVAGFAILLVYAVLTGFQSFWRQKSLWVTFLLVAGTQAAVNLVSGHGLLENAQYFNIYKTFFGNNWLTVPEQTGQGLFGLLLNHPGDFLQEYLPEVWKVALYAWPSVPLYFISREAPLKRFALFSGLVIALYSLPVAFGSSPRAPIAMTPLAFVAFGFLASETLTRLSTKRLFFLAALVVFLAALAWTGWQWYQVNTKFIHDFSDRHERYLRIERKLRAQGLTSPDQVFTNNYNFYLPITPPYYPRSNGGWDVTVTWNFRQEYPELPVETWEQFAAACRAQGIRFLVLSPYSYQLAPYFGDLYKETFIPLDVEFLGNDGNFQLIRLK
ncbi:MAG: hypothetical protein Fur0016_15670 [Anaerolineales bacterium]